MTTSWLHSDTQSYKRGVSFYFNERDGGDSNESGNGKVVSDIIYWPMHPWVLRPAKTNPATIKNRLLKPNYTP
jgi:hypothetical protein